MSWYPGAVKMELQPESDAQPAIRPTQFIMHSIAAPWTKERIFEYWRDSTNLESHFGLSYDGSLAQYVGTQTRADANYGANRRSDGTGAVSIETASNMDHTDPWTPAQVETLIRLGVWLHREHGIPLRVCRSAADPGYGYHRLFPEWSTGGTACPGDARVRQFRETVFPGIVSRASGGEADMTPEESAMLKALYEQRARAPWTYVGADTQSDAYAFLTGTSDRTVEIKNAVGALQTTGITPEQMDQLAAAIAANSDLTGRIAESVAEKLAARLAE
jgi:hypothetical protein